MRRLTCFLIWLILSTQIAISGEIPEILYISEAETPYPAWVVADRVLTPSGEVDPDLFSVADQVIISKTLKLPPRGGCIRWGRTKELETVGPRRSARQNLASTAKSAEWIFSATVTARAPGFNGSEPGTLLEIFPEEIFKGPRNRRGAHYIFVPIGEFSIGKHKICKTDERYAAFPELGARVVLFLDPFWQNEGHFLWTGEDSGIVTINEKGSISLPQRYQKTEPWLEGGDEGKLLGFIQKSIKRKTDNEAPSSGDSGPLPCIDQTFGIGSMYRVEWTLGAL
jgi:hypothetical protein